jgi:ABC-type dipeptide/oligopeptide/nickel transport system permease component
MRQFLIRRLISTALLLTGIFALTFTLARILPGDPARLLAGARASQDVVDKVRDKYGLDDPILVQFYHYVMNLFNGDLGISIVSRRPVLDDILQYFPATLELVLATFAIASVMGILIGMVIAIRARTLVDHGGRAFAIAGLSVPDFWIAILAQLLFYSTLAWFPFGGRLPTGMVPPEFITGLYTIDALVAGQFDLFRKAVWHLILPASVLSLASTGLLVRIVRASVLDVLNQDYIRMARAKGISAFRLYFRHVLSNAMLPIVTFMGLLFGFLLSGAVLVELVFNWPGIGRYTANAISSTDYNAIMGITVVVSTSYLFINLFVDLLYSKLDPRVKLS